MSFRLIISIGFLLLTTIVFAQEKTKKISIQSADYDQFMGVSIQSEGGSSNLTNEFLYKFVGGGKIDDPLKDKNLKRLVDLNFIGLSSQSSLFYRQENRTIFGLSNMGFQATIDWHNYMEMSFSKDFFNTLFYGNAYFSGQTANFDRTGFSTLNYYQIKAGLNRYSTNKKHYFLFNLALNLGNDFQLATAKNAGFYTSSLGDSLALTGTLQYNFIQSESTNPFDIFGFGGGIDLIYKYQIEDDFRMEAAVNQLGFIKWGKKSTQFNYQKPIIWEGLEVENILQMPNPLLNTTAHDSIISFIDENSISNSYTSFTPSEISLRAGKYIFGDKMEWEVGIKHQLFSTFTPQFDIKANIKMTKNSKISPTILYGGYSKFNLGVGFTFKNKGSQIKIETKYISGLIFNKTLSGIGGFINFTQQL